MNPETAAGGRPRRRLAIPAGPSWAGDLLLFSAAALVSGFTILRGISPHDEGLMLQAGARIAAGQWPYRDFWTNYPPGQGVLLAGLVHLFGPSLLAWRILRVAVDGAVSVLVYRLARAQSSRALALLAWLAAAGAMAFPTGPGPNPPALALGLGALVAARRRAVGGGALAGLAMLFRLELGVAAALGVVLSARGRRALAGALVAVAVAALGWAPFLIVGGHAAISDTIGFLGLQDLQRLPFPLDFDGALRPSKMIEFYAPAILVAASAAWVVAVLLERRARRAWAAAPLALVGLAYLFGRTDEFHLAALAVAVAILLAGEAARQPRRGLRAVLVGALALIAVYGLERRAGQALHPPALAAVPGGAGDGVKTSPTDARSLAALVGFVRRRVPAGQPIFVANPRHDLVHAGDPLLYVILERPNATRYDVMQPGVVTTAAVQREMVAELDRARTRLVVRWLDPRATLVEPDGAGRSSGVHLLDRYLLRRYRPVARFGVYAVLTRR